MSEEQVEVYSMYPSGNDRMKVGTTGNLKEEMVKFTELCFHLVPISYWSKLIYSLNLIPKVPKTIRKVYQAQMSTNCVSKFVCGKRAVMIECKLSTKIVYFS